MNAPKDGMLCPVCRVTLMMTHRQGIEIDYCPQCRGIWLDRGELDKLIERQLMATNAAPRDPEPPQPAAAPPYTPERYDRPPPYSARPYDEDRRYRDDDDDDDDDRRYRGGRKRRSFLADLFDFD